MTGALEVDIYARPTWVYRLFDNTGRLLYVGATCDLEARWAAHQREKAWWPEVASKQLVCFPNRFKALAAEATAIAVEAPLYNIGGTNGLGHHLRASRSLDQPEYVSRHRHPVMATRPNPELRAIAGAKLDTHGWTMNDLVSAAMARLVVDPEGFLEELSQFKPRRKVGRPPKT